MIDGREDAVFTQSDSPTDKRYQALSSATKDNKCYVVTGVKRPREILPQSAADVTHR